MKQFAIFDMDGTLIDSMLYWDRLATEYLGGRGIHPTKEQLAPIETMTLLQSSALFKEWFGFPESAEEIAAQMNGLIERHYREDIPLKEGALPLLQSLQAHGVRMIVATATDETLARACLGRLGALPFFENLFSTETIGISKEKPDIYLLCLEAFNTSIQPKDIAVIEDAPFSLHTAHAAGFYTIGMAEPVYADRWQEICALTDEAYRSFIEMREKLQRRFS